MDKAREIVEGYNKEVEVGQIYEAKVLNLVDFGAFVGLLPGQDGLLHVSEINHSRVDKPSDVLEVGQIVKVKVIGMDNGKISVSAKALLPRPEGMRDRRPSGGDRGGRSSGERGHRPSGRTGFRKPPMKK